MHNRERYALISNSENLKPLDAAHDNMSEMKAGDIKRLTCKTCHHREKSFLQKLHQYTVGQIPGEPAYKFEYTPG